VHFFDEVNGNMELDLCAFFVSKPTLHVIQAHFIYIPDEPENLSLLIHNHPLIDTSGYYGRIYPAVHPDQRQ
jgi:hypothetical protein